MNSLCVAGLDLVHPYRTVVPVCVQLPPVLRVILTLKKQMRFHFKDPSLDSLAGRELPSQRWGNVLHLVGSNRVIILWPQNLT